MTIKRAIAGTAAAAVIFVCGLAVGQQNVDPKLHPNLAEAQQHVSQALVSVGKAQKIWGDRLGGHAERAKDLLTQADGELKQAAEYANAHH